MKPLLRRLAATLLPALLVTLATPASAGELVLTDAPGSNWVVDNGEDSCRLLRTLGEGENQVTLLITQWAPGNGFAVTLTGRPLRNFSGDQLSLAFGDPSGPLGRRTAYFKKGRVGDNADVLIISGTSLVPPDADERSDNAGRQNSQAILPMLLPASVALADRIELSRGANRLSLQPTRFPDALGVLDACSQTRLPEWGLDAAAHRAMTRRAEPIDEMNLASRFMRHYPDLAMDAALHLRLLVDESGTITNCTLIAATATDRIPDSPCDFLAQKTLFRPALDAAGNPMRSFFITNIVGR